MKLKTTIFLTILFIAATSVFAQQPPPPPKAAETKPATDVKLPSANEIIDRYVKAIGGREANEKIKTRVTKGTIELAPMGVKGTTESFAAAPDKSYTKLSLTGLGDIIESYDGLVAWTINPLQGNRDKSGVELLQTKLASNFHREINLDKLYSNLTVKGTEKVGDREAYVVVGTPAGLEPQTFYFDVQNGHLLREDSTLVTPEGKTPIKTFYEDVRETEGVKTPHKMRVVTPQFEIITVVTEVKNNAPVDDKIFSKPAAK